ncbi:BolA family protein [Rhodoferax mekongensis]|uniref:BolA family protein n=1 Tax=Rhodoferax mekongensis TaxID=3068341 RepID=A0ABZ0AVJ4_9BURK|nr:MULTISPECIES: BolA family protein [unclassified Rhodoferax]MDT7515508.1 BolA family protein [Rhodoferax sp. TBRC 17199]WNO03681.1 BolA family protein [Rhodoferax sp. TBRC 17307]
MSANEPTAANLEQRLRERLQPVTLQVIDESYQHAGHVGANDSGVGTHFRVKIASPLFTGVSRVARHRLVYDSLQDFIDQGLHALAIEAEASPSGNSQI